MPHRARFSFATLCLILAACSKDNAAASSDSAGSTPAGPRDVEGAHFVGDSAALSAAVVALEDSASKSQTDAALLHRAAYAAYRRANLAGSDPAELKTQLARARTAIERANKVSPTAETYALLSSVVAREAVLDTARSAELTTLSLAAMDSANKLGPDNPRVLLMRGIAAFYTAVKDSGGPAVAERLLTRAIQQFGTETPAAGAPSWGHAEAHAWLGQAQSEQGKHAEAVATYQKALQIAPEYGWVQGALLPEAQAKAGSKKP